MTDKNQNLLERIDGLSPIRKRLLRARLQQAGHGQHSSGGARLIAYTTARDASSLDNARLREHCERRLPAYMVPQIFVSLSEMPRTASGKIDRQALQVSSWEHHSSTPPHDQELVMPRDEVEEKLATIWRKVLGIDEIGVHDNFFELGGDSLQIIRILSQAAKDGFSLKPDVIFSHPTIAEQARFVSLASAPAAARNETLKPMLMPIQHWFFQRIATHPAQWNQSFLLRADTHLEAQPLMQALHAVLAHHDALRARFVVRDKRWHTGQHDGQLTPMIEAVDISRMSRPEQDETITATANALNAGFDLATPPLLGVAHFINASGAADYLLICAHHLIIDAESWRIVLADLYSAYHAYASGETPSLPHTSTTLMAWANRLHSLARSAEFAPVKQFWQQHRHEPMPRIPTDETKTHVQTPAPELFNLERDSVTHTAWLASDDTEHLISYLPQTLRTRTHVILVSALARVIANWASTDAVMIDMEGHGREPLFDDVDISRTVGWFTSVFPVVFHGKSNDWQTPVGALRIAKQSMSSLPLNGLGYGLCKEYADDISLQNELNQARKSQILFNYLGNVSATTASEQAFTMVNDRCGTARHPDCQRAYLIEINALIEKQSLRVDWTYNSSLHRADTIAGLSQSFFAHVQEFMQDEQSSFTDAVVPTDFPLSGLDQDELDRLAQQLGDMDD